MMTLIESDSSSNSYQKYGNKLEYKSYSLTPFPFNPNTLDELGFKRLGLRDKVIRTILNYRSKGGKFYSKESLKRIYGLHDDEYSQLASYINIPSSFENKFESKKHETVIIELNTADTSQLISLRGIGSKLAQKIIQYRAQLGGFATLSQLKEVYGISEETYQMITPSLTINRKLIRTLNLNEATYYELNAHPYLHGELAQALVNFRKAQNYKIDNLNQIQEIALINEEIFRKIVPYLRIN